MSDGAAANVVVTVPGEGKSRMDNLFLKVEDYITKSISRFVAFLFILISAGAVLGYVVGTKGEGEIFILAPAVAGLLAYYNRDFAVAAFSIFVLIIFLL